MAIKKEVALPVALATLPDWAGLRRELSIVESFSEESLLQASAAAQREFAASGDRVDMTHLPFLTIDPADSMDLDQAMCLERHGDGFVVRYAIADVAAFVEAGSPLDVEAHQRGETFYAPDSRVGLYPPVLGEGAASLLPEQTRPAILWTMRLDAAAELLDVMVERALVRSRRRLDYRAAEALVGADEQIDILRAIGELRHQRAIDRGAVDLPTPEQLVEVDEGGAPSLVYRAPLACERWNAQISLLTGMAAAGLMVQAKVGLLRILPTPDPQAVDQLRLSAAALGLQWPKEKSYGEYVTCLDPNHGPSAAMLTLSTRLLRGAGYLALDGEVPDDHRHSAVAAAYAHCTAPLRRYADRHVNEICVRLSAGEQVDDELRAALATLPEAMKKADSRAHALQRATVDLAEATVMAARMDETFDAVVVAVDTKGGTIQIGSPAVRGRCIGALTLGAAVTVKCTLADVKARKVEFAVVSE